MRIGAAHAQRIHTGAARTFVRAPVAQAVIHLEGRAFKINRRVWCLISKAGRQLFVMQAERGFDQARCPCRRVQMPDIGFDRPNPAIARFVGGFAKGFGQRGDLDRVAQIGACAVAFDIINRIGANPCQPMGLGNGRSLSVHAGGEIAGFGGTIIIDGRGADDAPDVIIVSQRIRHAAQHNNACATAKDRALGAVIKGVAMPVWREDFAILKHIAAPMWHFDCHPTGQRHVAFAVQKRLHRIMGRDKRG